MAGMQPASTSSESPCATPGTKRQIALNVRVLMAQRGYRNVRALYQDVLQSGAEISYSQFARIVDNQSEKLNLSVVEALLNLFDCPITDLIVEAQPFHSVQRARSQAE
jgi:hypothetical protein